MFRDSTEEQNEKRITLMETNWKKDIIQTVALLEELETGDNIDFETDENDYNILRFKNCYYVLETPTKVTAGWKQGEIYSYQDDRLSDLVVMLLESKY